MTAIDQKSVFQRTHKNVEGLSEGKKRRDGRARMPEA